MTTNKRTMKVSIAVKNDRAIVSYNGTELFSTIPQTGKGAKTLALHNAVAELARSGMQSKAVCGFSLVIEGAAPKAAVEALKAGFNVRWIRFTLAS